jgi:hypothetical protein
VSLVLLVLMAAHFFWLMPREFAHGGSTTGIVYGIAATALVVLLMLLGWRKRAYRSRLGTLEGWTQSHAYLGMLVVAVVVFHSGLRFEDRLAVAALVVMIVVVLSGVVGAVLYTAIPMLLTAVESDAPLPEISSELNSLGRAMERAMIGKSDAFRRIGETLLRQTRPGPFAGWRLLITRAVATGPAAGWEGQLGDVPPIERDDLNRLLVQSRQRLELERSLLLQQRYRNLLQVWLFVHLPLSFVLLLLIAAHIVSAVFFSSGL